MLTGLRFWNNAPMRFFQIAGEPGGGGATPTPAATPTEPTPATPPGQAATPQPGIVNPPGQDPQFTNIDLSKLSPELQQAYRSMQGDYTRKTQEIATIRKAAEQFGVTPDQLPQYLQQVNQVSQFQNQVQQIYQTQGPLAARNFVEQAMGIQNGGFQPGFNQQPQVDPLANRIMNQLSNVYDPEQLAGMTPLVNAMAAAFRQEMAPATQFVNSTQAEQKTAIAVQQISTMAGQLGKMIDDGRGGKIVDPMFENAVFDYAIKNNITDPNMMGYVAMQVAGGVSAIQQASVANYLNDLKTKQPTGTTIPAAGVSGVVQQPQIWDPSKSPSDNWDNLSKMVYEQGVASRGV